MSRVYDPYADMQPSGFDYILTAISGVVTAYSVGMAVANPVIGYIFIVLALLGIWISFAITRTIGSPKLSGLNGFVYAGGVFAAFMTSRTLCDLLPDNPFKAQIAIAGALCWMLVFGSFLIWSDQTLLFQAVPCIAIFGLIGCYDTYQNATWMFFAFLLCFATLLARVHGRTMLKQAKESGYSETGDRMDRSATELERMRSGPWKWVAGPQWALGSAFVIILFSFIGAPIIRQSVQGVTANVIVQAPITSAAARAFAAGTSDGVNSSIGRGPSSLRDIPVLLAKLDEPRYMRTNIYQNYTVTGWNAQSSGGIGGEDTNVILDRARTRLAISSITDKKEIEFEIEPLSSRITVLPVPGELSHIDPVKGTDLHLDGTLGLSNPENEQNYKGRSVISDESKDPTTAWRDLPTNMSSLLSTSGVPQAVYDLANEVSANGTNDYERAQLIKQEIERRVVYNLEAPATPEGWEPVEYFLFQSKQGYCDLFASAMTLMARSVGIPARYVIGFYPISGKQDADGRYIILESERHAWAELFFEDRGWVVFDATEGARAVPGAERGKATASNFADSPILKLGLDILIGAGVVVVLFLIVRAARRSSSPKQARSDLDREYLRYVGVLTKATGRSRNFDQTPAEYVAEISPYLNGAAEAASALTRRFERLFYSADPPTVDDLKAVRTDIQNLRALLKESRPR